MNMLLHATGASFIAMTQNHNPRDLVIELLESMHGEQREKIFDEFRRRLREDDAYQRAVDWYFFVNMHDYLTTSRNKRRSPEQRAQTKQARDDLIADLQRRIVNVVLMDLVMPNGKRLADCTFGELAKFGGWLTKVAKKGKPNQIVGKVLTEKQLRAIK